MTISWFRLKGQQTVILAGVQVDLLIEQDGKLYPIEFKKTASPSLNAVKSFKTMEGLGLPMGPGAVICLKKQMCP